MLKQCFEPNCFRVRLRSVDVDVDFLASPGKQNFKLGCCCEPASRKARACRAAGSVESIFRQWLGK